ncbi:hypothetical protein ID853_16905 [Xenorhabdus sp. Vera]|nr:hypothetical protein [Xenorhabdus sp. Vera]
MKDAEEPETQAYDLRVVELFTDKDGEDITSLALRKGNLHLTVFLTFLSYIRKK